MKNRKNVIWILVYTFVIIFITAFGTYKMNMKNKKEVSEKAFKKGKESAKPDVVFLKDFNGDKLWDVIVQQKNGYRYPLTCSQKGGHIICQRPVEIDAKDLENKINKK